MDAAGADCSLAPDRYRAMVCWKVGIYLLHQMPPRTRRARCLTSSKSQEVLPVVQVLALRSHLCLLGLQVLLQGCQLALQRCPVLHGARLGQLLQGGHLDRLPPVSCVAAARSFYSLLNISQDCCYAADSL